MHKIPIFNNGVERIVAFFALFFCTGGFLATPLLAAPGVFLSVLSFVIMLKRGVDVVYLSDNLTQTTMRLLIISFGFWFLSTLILAGLHGISVDNSIRFILAIGIFWIIRYTRVDQINLVLYSIIAGIVVAAMIALYQQYVLGVARVEGWANNPIYFGNLIIMLCIYAVIALLIIPHSLQSMSRFALAASIPLAIYVNFTTGTRSTLVALVLLFVYLVINGYVKIHRIRHIVALLVPVLLLVISIILMPRLLDKMRVTESLNEVVKIEQGDFSSSTGQRLQMWKGAFLIFMKSPLIGVGSSQYKVEMRKLTQTGVIPGVAVYSEGEHQFNEPHSVIMESLSTKGLLGFVAYLLIVILPYRAFSNLKKSSKKEVVAVALMGQATVISFVIFGLTLSIFRIQIYSAFYPLSIAMFAALALNLQGRKEE